MIKNRTMNIQYRIILVTPENIDDHPQAICFINPKHELYNKKVEWYRVQFAKGMRIKLIYPVGENKAVGFIEYTPGEYCWRPVMAKGYMFIHCIWINGKKIQHQGLGSLLVKEVEKDAVGMAGVAVVTSDSAFMAKSDLFIKIGYREISKLGKEYLLVKQFHDGSLPSFIVRPGEADRNKGLTIIYSRQCPWVARFIEEVKPFLKAEDLRPVITEITSAAEAQEAPSAYGVLNIIHNGKILADRYISTTRFTNIVRKEMK